MAYSIDISYFKELAEKKPEDLCLAALCDYDKKEKAYILPVWGEDY